MLTTCLNSRQPDMSVLDCLLVRKKDLAQSHELSAPSEPPLLVNILERPFGQLKVSSIVTSDEISQDRAYTSLKRGIHILKELTYPH